MGNINLPSAVRYVYLSGSYCTLLARVTAFVLLLSAFGTAWAQTFGSTLITDPNPSGPPVTSLYRVNPSVTNLPTVNWTLTFALAKTGVNASDFSLSGPAAAGATIGTPTTSDGGVTWNVSVTTGSIDGTLTLNGLDAIEIIPGVPTTVPFEQSYTIDKTAPTISIGQPSVSTIAAGARTVTYTVSYADANLSASTLENGSVTLNTTGGASGTVNVTGSGNTRTVEISSIIGAGTLGITIDAGTATDLAGNSALSAGPSTTFTVTTPVFKRPPFWSHQGGSTLAKQKGVYPGAIGGTGTPGARYSAATWSDGEGNLYVFGGLGFGSTIGPGNLNDLWKLDLVTKTWTFLGGGQDINGTPTYGSKGLPASENLPGARSGATTWMDAAGDLWLFGGVGRDSSPTGGGPLNDLWKYDISLGQWIWVSGDNGAKINGVYTGAGAKPGGRSAAAGWTDQLGNFYLFGGNGMALTGTANALMNDLWKYDINAGTWTHLKGLQIAKGLAIYGVKGVPGTSNTPSARSGSSAWTGPDGMFYLFGGSANNDLWKYNPSANVWTWINGQSKPGGKGVYTVLGVADSRNEPAGRSGASSWVGPDGSLMLFGGLGIRDDVWSYNLTTNLWTWVKGSPLAGAKPLYGPLEVGSEPNTPGARHLTSVAVDSRGDVWTFGGVNGANSFSDLFKLDVAAETLATTLAASGITDTDAVISGEANPNGFQTRAWFRYSKLLDFSEVSQTTAVNVGKGTAAVAYTGTLSGLELGTTYYYQAVAANDFSTSYGAVKAFTTTGTAASTIQFAASSSTVTESVGTAIVTVTLSKPSATAVTAQVTNSGGSPIDVAFVPGQTTALVPVTISSNTTPDPNFVLNLGLGPITGEPTVGAQASHALTVQDDDQALTVVSHPLSQFVAVRDSLILSVSITGSGPIGYQWKKSGKAIKGATAAACVIHNVTAAAAGVYTVDVTNPGGTVTSNPADVYVVDATPKSFVTTINKPVSLSVTARGAPTFTYLWKKGVSAAPGVNNTSTYLAPVTASDTSEYFCEVSAGSVMGQGGVNTVRVAAVTAVTYPAGMVGTYLGIIDRNPAVGTNLGARFDLTTTASGAFTGKLTGLDVASTMKGVMIPTLSGATATSATGRADFIRKGKPTLRLTFTLDATDGLTGELLEEDTNSVQAFTGYRNKWLAAKSLPADYHLDADAKPARYTFALEIPANLAGAYDIPQGNGFGSFTATADGKATLVGFTADGFAYTSSSFVGPTGQVGIYSLFKARVGSIAGTGNIGLNGAAGVNNTVQGKLTWSKEAALPTAKDQLYRAGFAPIELTIIGGKYKAPALGGVVAGLANADNNACVVFAEGGLANGQIDGGVADAKTNSVVFTIKNTGNAAVQTVILPLLSANPNKHTFKLAAKPLGQFSGTFTVPNPNTLLIRTAKYQGMIVWTGSSYIAPGYFILNQLPEPGQTVKTSTQLSGVLDLEPNP